MSQKTVFHLSAGVCFVIAVALYVMGFAAPDGPAAFFLILAAAFETLCWMKLMRSWRAQERE